MNYILLIHADESEMGSMTADDVATVIEAMDRFDRELTEASQNLGSIRLVPSANATTLHKSGGRTTTKDGPFAETKEQLGGIYLIEAADNAEALAIAERLPKSSFATIEVRPIMGIDIRNPIATGI